MCCRYKDTCQYGDPSHARNVRLRVTHPPAEPGAFDREPLKAVFFPDRLKPDESPAWLKHKDTCTEGDPSASLFALRAHRDTSPQDDSLLSCHPEQREGSPNPHVSLHSLYRLSGDFFIPARRCLTLLRPRHSRGSHLAHVMIILLSS